MKKQVLTRSSGKTPRRTAALWVAAATMLVVCTGVVQAAQPGDTEPNEAVDLRDLLAIRNAFGETGPPGFEGADVDSNGVVDNADLLIWRANFPFLGSPLAPYIFISAPLDQSLIGDRRPTVVIDYGGTTLNVDPATLQVTVDGVDRSAEAVKSFTNAMVQVESLLADGPHYVEASIQDVQGTTGNDRSDFEVTTLTLLPKVTPVIGPAPLEATFTPDVVWADDPPSQYLWDYDNDGVWDNGSIGAWDSSARPDLEQHTFFEEGLHTVRFGVHQGGIGLTTEKTIQVAVTESFASISPSNGRAPLTVFLHGIAADIDDPIVEYAWDYDYNGAFSADFVSTTSPNTTRVYTTAGTYRPVFRTTHLSGAIVEHPIVQEELRVQPSGAPTAIAAAAQGSDALTVNFSGSGSDNGAITLYEWDFDNDGTWDYSSPTSGTVSHAYPTAGVKVAALRVTDNDSNTSVDRVRVETFAPATLEVLDDTVAPANQEVAAIRTETTIDATVSLYIRAKDQTLITGEVVPGRVIRTLVDNEFRPAGTYEDAWDGRDFRFEPAHPDAYYAVLEYSYPGRTDVLDLADTSGGNHYFAPKVSPVATTLDPINDEPLPMRFTISSASRASLYVLPGGNNRADTIFDNLALGAGEYLYFWAGFDSEGAFASPATYLWTVNAWTLGDNAIVVQGGPDITDLEITPNLLSPTDRPLGSATAEVSFALTRPASVFAKIINIDENAALRSFQIADLPAGPNSIVWDGKAENGEYATPGFYRLSLFAVDSGGNLSIEREGVMKIRY